MNNLNIYNIPLINKTILYYLTEMEIYKFEDVNEELMYICCKYGEYELYKKFYNNNEIRSDYLYKTLIRFRIRNMSIYKPFRYRKDYLIKNNICYFCSIKFRNHSHLFIRHIHMCECKVIESFVKNNKFINI